MDPEGRGRRVIESFIIHPQERKFHEKLFLAELALEGLGYRHTNKIERLMEEAQKVRAQTDALAKRGAENALSISLVRCTSMELYNQFKNAYTHNITLS